MIKQATEPGGCFSALLTEHRIFHQCDSLVVKYNVLANYLYAIRARDQTPAIIAAEYERILLYLRRERCQRLLDNHEAIHGYLAGSADWLSQDWYPRARQTGFKNHATDILARRSTEEALQSIAGGSVAGFVDLAMARQVMLRS